MNNAFACYDFITALNFLRKPTIYTVNVTLYYVSILVHRCKKPFNILSWATFQYIVFMIFFQTVLDFVPQTIQHLSLYTENGDYQLAESTLHFGPVYYKF